MKANNTVIKIDILDSNDYSLFKETFQMCLKGMFIYYFNTFFLFFKNGSIFK